MADVREVFPILQDASGAGIVADQMQSGFSPVGKNGVLVFGFRDSSGNVVLPQLTSDGKLPVSSSTPGTQKDARDEVVGGDTSTSGVDVATITLTADKKYVDLQMLVSCSRSALFQAIWSDDGSETVLGDIILGPGQYTFGPYLTNVEFTAGSTGTQELILRARNLNAASTLRGTIAILELA
jgi:hypothetical protein